MGDLQTIGRWLVIAGVALAVVGALGMAVGTISPIYRDCRARSKLKFQA